MFIFFQRVHADTADDSRKFRCEECSCSFRKLGSLNAHISRVHYGSIINQEVCVRGIVFIKYLGSKSLYNIFPSVYTFI